MTRPLRLEFPGALYHVTSRGDRCRDIFFDQADRFVWLNLLAKVCSRYGFIVHSFCQMTNHYHLVVETVNGDLARGMRQLNGAYSQHFNRRHKLVGHMFQGRYHAVLVQKENYLLELSRYVVLNPLRAGMVATLDDWHWSSYPYFMRTDGKPDWLDTDSTLGYFSSDQTAARRLFKEFILNGGGVISPLSNVQHQLLLGDRDFVAKHAGKPGSDALDNVARTHRQAVLLTLDDYAVRYERCDEAMAQAYASMGYSMREIARHFGTSAKTVSRAVKHFEIDSSRNDGPTSSRSVPRL